MLPKPLLAALAWLVLAAPAFAQAPSAPSPGPNSGRVPGHAMDARLDRDEAQLRAIRAAARSKSLDDATLKAQLAAIGPIQDDLADALSTLTPRLQDTQERLAELGAPPAAGQPPEAVDIADNRARLQRLQQTFDGGAKRARLLTVEASQLDDALSDRLRRNFSTRLWAHGRSALDPALWRDFAASLPGDLRRLGATFSGQRPGGAQAALFLILGLLLLAPARLLLDRLGRRWSVSIVPSSSLRRSALALWLVAVGGVAPLLAGLALRQALVGDTAQPALAQLAGALARALFFAGIFEALGRALLAPGRPSWRLAPIPDAVADRLAPYPAVVGVTIGLVSLVSEANRILGASLTTSTATDCLSILAELVAAGCGLAMLGRARSAHAASAEQESEALAKSRLPWILAAFAAWLALAAALGAVVAGYLPLATFIMRELIWIAMVLASLFLLMRFVDDLCQALFGQGGPLGRLFETAIGLSHDTLDQIGVLLSGLLRLALMLFGWAAIVAPFGASARDIFGRVTSPEVVFKLGQLSISPGLIFGAVAVFAVALAVTRLIRGWLEATYLPKTRIDVGVRTSITAGLTYLGGLVAVLLTCAYLGLSLDKIALFASALSVGIGFGLQAVIGNFVSGLILLAERPVKVGDWIAIGDLEGDVRRINIRATEIEMADRSKLVVPNSDLISKTVRNITHGGALGRVKIVLRVGNDADAGEVRDLLLARLSGHPEVLAEPAPGAFLTDLPDGAFEFTALAHLASPRHAFRVRSELLFLIVGDLKARDIRLASSSTVIQMAGEA